MKVMEHNNTGGLGSMAISILSAIIAWIGLKEAQILVTIGASTMALISGYFAAKYYYYAAKEKRDSLRNKKETKR